MAIITIDGVDLPSPSSLSISLQDLDSEDTGRNELGVLQRSRLRQGVYKIELGFNVIDNSKVQTILSSIVNEKVSVTFPTQVGFETREMYVGDRKVDSVLYRDGNDPKWTVSFNLIEY
ncbi:MAG TPA: DUF6711 family protein [Tissierellaceae bacterium]|nr:DUF6711 family protein [Tissierellaceae bacterium]